MIRFGEDLKGKRNIDFDGFDILFSIARKTVAPLFTFLALDQETTKENKV